MDKKHQPECYGPCCPWLENCDCQCDCDRIEKIYQRGFMDGLLQAATYSGTTMREKRNRE